MYETFEKLKNERGITTYKVAQDTGLTQTMFSDWKNGKSRPKADKLKILAEYFGVNIEVFIA